MPIRIFLASALALAAENTSAQEVVDGTDRDFEEPIALLVVEALAGRVAEPNSTKIAGLHRALSDPERICGFVNLKHPTDGYVGFEPFILKDGKLELQTTEDFVEKCER